MNTSYTEVSIRPVMGGNNKQFKTNPYQHQVDHKLFLILEVLKQTKKRKKICYNILHERI